VPTSTIGFQDAYEGFDWDVAQFIAQVLHKRLKLKKLSWGDFLKELGDETVDIVSGPIAITDDRLQDIAMIHVYGKPYPYLAMAFWDSTHQQVLKNAKHIRDLVKFFKKRSVGVAWGTVWERLLKKYGILNVKTYESIDHLISALKEGEVAAIVLGIMSADCFQKQHSNVWFLKLAVDAPYSYGVGIALKKERTELIKKIADVIQELKDDGTITMLQLKWFGKTF
jgi:polar amino acid transport system substrate-binding protein